MVKVKWFGHCCYLIQSTTALLTKLHDGTASTWIVICN